MQGMLWCVCYQPFKTCGPWPLPLRKCPGTAGDAVNRALGKRSQQHTMATASGRSALPTRVANPEHARNPLNLSASALRAA